MKIRNAVDSIIVKEVIMELTKDDVRQYLDCVKDLVLLGKWKLQRREKNNQLFIDYILNREDVSEILLSLDVMDFCKADYNHHEQYPDEIVYVFGKDISLIPRFKQGICLVSIYIKLNLIKDKILFVVSFHKQEFPLKYKFRNGV